MTNEKVIEVIKTVRHIVRGKEIPEEALTRAIISLRGIKMTINDQQRSVFEYPNGITVALITFSGTLEEALKAADKEHDSITKTQRGDERTTGVVKGEDGEC